MQGSTQWERSHRSQAVRPLGVPPAVIWLCAGAVLMLMSVPRLGAQDPLASARSLYASAAYDEALKTLQELSSDGGGRIAGASFREVEEYRFLCLLALGRNSEARESISAVVTADPLYKLDENTTSPRVMTAFRTVRREVLPDILNNIYNAAKSMYDAKDYKGAEPQFRKVIGLVGDPDLGGKGSDLATLS
jgi:tetratricopeptide (TPR) repeat protein